MAKAKILGGAWDEDQLVLQAIRATHSPLSDEDAACLTFRAHREAFETVMSDMFPQGEASMRDMLARRDEFERKIRAHIREYGVSWQIPSAELPEGAGRASLRSDASRKAGGAKAQGPALD